jgi:hypothetical protein
MHLVGVQEVALAPSGVPRRQEDALLQKGGVALHLKTSASRAILAHRTAVGEKDRYLHLCGSGS